MYSYADLQWSIVINLYWFLVIKICSDSYTNIQIYRDRTCVDYIDVLEVSRLVPLAPRPPTGDPRNRTWFLWWYVYIHHVTYHISFLSDGDPRCNTWFLRLCVQNVGFLMVRIRAPCEYIYESVRLENLRLCA